MAADGEGTDDDLDGPLLRAAATLESRGLVVGSVGNASVRCEDGMRITPTRVRHSLLSSEDLVTLDFAGQPLRGFRRPSLEWPLHAAIYRARHDVHAVLHTHSPHATAWSCLGRELPAHTEDLDYYDVGRVRTAPYADPGTRALADGTVTALGSSRAVLLARHGVITVADDPAAAVVLAELIEHQAVIAWLLHGALPSCRSPA